MADRVESDASEPALPAGPTGPATGPSPPGVPVTPTPGGPAPADDALVETFTGIFIAGSITVDRAQPVQIFRYRDGRTDIVQAGVPVARFSPDQVASLGTEVQDYLDSRPSGHGPAIGCVVLLIALALLLAFVVLAVGAPGEILGWMLLLPVAAAVTAVIGLFASVIHVGTVSYEGVRILRLVDGRHLTITS